MLSLSSRFFVSALVLFFCQHHGVLLLLFLFVYFRLHVVSTPVRRLSLVAIREWGPLFVVGHELPIAVAPLVGEHKFEACELQQLQYLGSVVVASLVESSQIRAQTCVSVLAGGFLTTGSPVKSQLLYFSASEFLSGSGFA